MFRLWTVLIFCFSTSSALKIKKIGSDFDSDQPTSFATLNTSSTTAVPPVFVLCTSHEQDTLDGNGFFHVLGENSQPWFSMILRQETAGGSVQLWVVVGPEGVSYMMGGIPLFKMKIWYHLCSSLDTVNGAFAIAVNGEILAKAWMQT